jgi:serine/threonine protein kinase
MTWDGAGSTPSGDDAWRPPAPSEPPAPEHLDGYADLVEVGRGGDSVVYRGREVALGRDVAIKVLSLDTAGDPARAARFAREIEITVQLGRQHPNIVTVLATGTTASGKPAVVMDFFEGGTLHDRLRAHGPLPAEEVGRIGEVLADALSFAHERGVLHRDVKPQNVLVLPTSWVLADFGIARLVGSEHTSSAETFTYRHAAPQILDGHPPTAADDIWSLGSTLFTLLDGRPPFASDDPDEDSALAYLRRARTEEPRPLTVPGSERIAPVIERCLSKDVAGRWASAAELRDALQALRASAWQPAGGARAGSLTLDKPAAPPSAYPPPPPPPTGGHTPTPTPTPTQTQTQTPAPGSPYAGPIRPISPSPIGPRTDPVEPAPVALSAVSHVVRTPDADTTGTGVVDPTGAPPPPATAPGTVDDEPPRRRRLPYVLGAAALAVGLTLGIAGAALRSGDDDPVQAQAPTETGTESAAAIPLPDFPTLEARPTLPITLEYVKYDGRNISVRFTDPTDGEGSFRLVLLAEDTPSVPIAGYPPGSGRPEETVELKDALPLGPACFYMVVALPTGTFGTSGRRCYTVTPFGLDAPA